MATHSTAAPSRIATSFLESQSKRVRELCRGRLVVQLLSLMLDLLDAILGLRAHAHQFSLLLPDLLSLLLFFGGGDVGIGGTT